MNGVLFLLADAVTVILDLLFAFMLAFGLVWLWGKIFKRR